MSKAFPEPVVRVPSSDETGARAGPINRSCDITIDDFARLEAAACSCRDTIDFPRQEIIETPYRACEA